MKTIQLNDEDFEYVRSLIFRSNEHLPGSICIQFELTDEDMRKRRKDRSVR